MDLVGGLKKNGKKSSMPMSSTRTGYLQSVAESSIEVDGKAGDESNVRIVTAPEPT